MRYTAALFCLLVGVSLRAEEWPQFRGPTGQGHSTEVGLPLEWSESRNIAWKVPVDGSGWSSPVVAGGRVWLTAARPSGRSAVSLRAMAFDVATGRVVVDTEVFKISTATALNPKNSRASPTPIVDGDRVYVHFGPDGTAALTTAGAVLWTKKLPYEPQHGGGGSPALYRDLLIVNCDGNGDEAYVIALDTRTGQTRWRKDRRRPAAQAYSTPLIIRSGDRDLAISVGAFRTSAYDPNSGDEIWRVGYDDGFSNVPRPVFGAGLVFIATGFNSPTLIAVRPDGRGDVTRSHVAWTVGRGAPYTPSPLLVDDAALLRERYRRAHVRRCRIREDTVAAAARGQLLRVADLRRWPHLLLERRGRDDSHRRRPDVPEARREHARRADTRVDRGLGRRDVHPERRTFVQGRRSDHATSGSRGPGHGSEMTCAD